LHSTPANWTAILNQVVEPDSCEFETKFDLSLGRLPFMKQIYGCVANRLAPLFDLSRDPKAPQTP